MDTASVKAARLIVSSFLTAFVGIALGTGCFSEPTPNCAFTCIATSECPGGYFCASDNFCKRDGVDDAFSCGVSSADAASDDTPTITAIADQTTSENTVLGPIAFTIGDLETAASALTVTAVSSNLTVVPQVGIALGGTDENRTITITPATDETGASTVTITVSDGVNMIAEAFLVTVNSAPTITTVGDQLINVDTNTGPLAFTIGDTETATSALTVTATSDNTTLVPNNVANLTLGGADASRTLTVTPATGAVGIANITITVDDGGDTNQTTFELTVNSLPTISAIGVQTIAEDGNTGALAFTIGDVETAVTALVVTALSNNTTLVDTGEIVLAGMDANRTITVTPKANQFGTATITVTVNDGDGGTAQEPFLLTVTGENDPPTVTAPDDLMISQDTSTTALAVAVSDVETAAASLMLSAASSNTALVDAGDIVLGGSDGARTITVTPNAGQTGNTTITLTIDDGTTTTNDTFVLTVI